MKTTTQNKLFKNFLTLGFILFCCVAMAFEPSATDTTKGLISKGKFQVAMANARARFLEGDARRALLLYRHILINHKKNAVVHFRIAECHHHLGSFKRGLESLKKASRIDSAAHKEMDYIYGLIYHRLEELDLSLKHYEKFLAALEGNKKKIEELQVARYIEQVKTAGMLMEKPVDVTIKSMGKTINSRYPEYHPTLTPDGRSIYFTGRRPDGKGGRKSSFDFKYYEDIYRSDWDEIAREWSTPEQVEKVNTDDWDAVNAITMDGAYLYMSQNIYKYTKSTDITYARKSGSGKWGKPKKLGKTINTTYYEGSASITGDGKTMFFVSERPGGQGRADIYKVEKVSRREWGEPVNLGPLVNSSEDENFVFVHPAGKIIFFGSKGHDGMGGYDIFKSELVDGTWTQPVNLGFPINTTADDTHFKITGDGTMGYFTSNRNNGYGETDIYTADLVKYPVLKAEMVYRTHGWITGSVSHEDGQPVQCTIQVFNKKAKRLLSEVKTNAQGVYEVKLPGNASYELRIKAGKFKASTEEVELRLHEHKETRIAQNFMVKKQ